jgi:osmotically-inducible protein OsmY
MKTAYKLTIMSSLLLVAGCTAWHEKHAKNEQNNEQFSNSSQSQLNLPGATENKEALGGTTEQSTTAQSTGTQSSQTAVPAQSANEQSLANPTAQPPAVAPDQQPPDQSLIGQNALSLTNQNSTAHEQKPPDQNLSPTADQQSTSRIYNTDQSTLGTSDALGKGTADNFNVKIQAATEADRTLGQQVVQELKTDTSLAALLPKIRLNVESGKITLSGTVKSEDQKQKIESAVKRVSGVANVEDHLRVSASSGENSTPQDNQQENK